MKGFSPLALAALLVGACGAHNAGSVVRPKEVTAGEALGDRPRPATTTCTPSDDDRVLVVDAPAEDRKAMEEMLKRKRVPVARYDCKTLVLLERCKLDSEFTYTGTALRDRLVRVASADEATANIPISSASLRASVASGQKVDLALAEVGSRVSSFELLTRRDLGANRPQDCEGATHFIHKVDVGAFALAQHASGEAATAAQLWTASATGESRSDRSSTRSEGKVESCRTASEKDSVSPENCGVPLRVHLRRIEAPPAPVAPVPVVAPSCDGDSVRSEGGVCIQRVAGLRYVCRGDDLDECAAQCAKGNVESCVKQSHFHLYGLKSRGVPVPRSFATARAIVEKTCVPPYPKGCIELMASHNEWPGGNAPSDEEVQKGFEAVAVGCRANDPDACSVLGGNLLMTRLEGGGFYDVDRGVAVSERACRLGAASSCHDLGWKLFTGLRSEDGKEALGRDRPRGIALVERACALRDERACAELPAMRKRQTEGDPPISPPPGKPAKPKKKKK